MNSCDCENGISLTLVFLVRLTKSSLLLKILRILGTTSSRTKTGSLQSRSTPKLSGETWSQAHSSLAVISVCTRPVCYFMTCFWMCDDHRSWPNGTNRSGTRLAKCGLNGECVSCQVSGAWRRRAGDWEGPNEAGAHSVELHSQHSCL